MRNIRMGSIRRVGKQHKERSHVLEGDLIVWAKNCQR